MPRTQRRSVTSSQIPCDEQHSSLIQADSIQDNSIQVGPIQDNSIQADLIQAGYKIISIQDRAIKADSIQDGTIQNASIQNALNEDVITDKVDTTMDLDIADKLDNIIGVVINQSESKEEESDFDPENKGPIVPTGSLDTACVSSVDEAYKSNNAEGANLKKRKGEHVEEKRIKVKEGVWVELNEIITKRAKELKSNFPNMSMEKALRVCAKNQCDDGSKDGKVKPSSKSKAIAKPSSKSKAIAKPSSIGASSSSTDLIANVDSVDENTIELLENIVGIKPSDGESDAKRLENVANRYADRCNLALDANHHENVLIVWKNVMEEFGSICKSTIRKLWLLEINYGLRKEEDEYNSGEEFDKRTLRFVQETGEWSDKVTKLIQEEGKFDKIVDELVNLHNEIDPGSMVRV